MILYRLENYTPENLCRILRDGCTPTIDYNRHETENATIPRICTATSIQNCMTALGPYCIAQWFMEQYQITIDELQANATKPFRFIIMKFDTRLIPQEDIMNSFELYRKDYVPDAYITKEYWLLSPHHPVSISIRDLDTMNLYGEEQIIPYKYFRKKALFDENTTQRLAVQLIRRCRWKNCVTVR